MSASPASHVLDRTLSSWRADIDRTLEHIVPGLNAQDPVTEAVRYSLRAGGKRLRPMLCLAAMDAVGAAGTPAEPRLRAAVSLELIHTYSLVHDDLPCMDDDDLRRGRATTHRVFGTPAAMAAGVALVPLACNLLDGAAVQLGVPADVRREAVYELCVGAGAAGMVGGQLLDLEAEGHAVDGPGLARIHAMKTGALFRAALRVGGRLGGGAPALLDALGTFGERLGVAFQITDDVLDVTMDAGALGKTPGKDSAADKASFVSLLGEPRARAAAQEEAAAAIDALRRQGVESSLLEGLARFAVTRDR